MTEHKHAAVLRAIADGVPLSEFGVSHKINYEFTNMGEFGGFQDWIIYPNEWEVRRKPQTITVNGFKVPKPLDSSAKPAEVWFPDFERPSLSFCYQSVDTIKRIINNGCAHSTQEAAIAHAKAMLGIDPEAA